jgi:peptidoglycan/LPS O-acetylase OafA/YrhL
MPDTAQFSSAGTAKAGAARNQYVPSLDGLRAVSILLVMLSHAGLGHLVPGGLGVTIFFAISGYLITGQMVAEVERTGRLDLRQFYLRRFFRLAPALIVYIAIMTPVALLMGADMSPQSIAASALYIGNYWWIFHGYGDFSPFPILWSLSIEEQFYILFPCALSLAVPRLERAILPVAGIMLAVLLWRVHVAQLCIDHAGPWAVCGLPQRPDMPEGARIYLGTDTRFDCILAGVLAALTAVYAGARWRRRLLGNVPLCAALAALLLSLLVRDAAFRDTLRYSIQSMASAVIILNLAHGRACLLRRVLSYGGLVHIGRLSYSLYLYHFATRLIIVRVLGGFTWQSYRFYLFFACSFLLAVLSYYYVERPMLRLRHRFGSHAA